MLRVSMVNHSACSSSTNFLLQIMYFSCSKIHSLGLSTESFKNRPSTPIRFQQPWARSKSEHSVNWLRLAYTLHYLAHSHCKVCNYIDRLTLLSAINAAHADIACWGLKCTVHTCMQYNDSPFLAIWACVCDRVHHLVHISSTLCNNTFVT